MADKPLRAPGGCKYSWQSAVLASFAVLKSLQWVCNNYFSRLVCCALRVDLYFGLRRPTRRPTAGGCRRVLVLLLHRADRGLLHPGPLDLSVFALLLLQGL